MFSVKDFKKEANKKVAPGNYIARVSSVYEDEDTVGCGAIILEYELTDPTDGEVVDFKEKFYKTTANERTKALVKLMEELGIEEIEDIVDAVISVEIKNNVTNDGRSFPSIVSRKIYVSDDTLIEEL